MPNKLWVLIVKGEDFPAAVGNEYREAWENYKNNRTSGMAWQNVSFAHGITQRRGDASNEYVRVELGEIGQKRRTIATIYRLVVG